MRLSCLACTGIAAAALGCSSLPFSRTAALPPLSMQDIRTLVTELAAIRGLPERAPIPIAMLDETAFARILRQRMDEGIPTDDSARRASFLMAFNLLPQQGIQTSSTREVLEEQITAFYDLQTRSVFIRSIPPQSEDELWQQRGVLAHEIEHALQAQHFSFPDLDLLPGEDIRLAHLAVLEGDAMVTMGAYLAAQHGAPLKRLLRRMADASNTSPLETLEPGNQHAALRRALPIVRERLLFPYFTGMSMVADLCRAGGFPLVNLLFKNPPVSTEQVLHPDKYLAGELPIMVQSPQIPPGYQLIASEPLGQLQTRVVLERCVGPAEAKIASQGWGGDRFSILAGPNQKVALLWSTAWDNPDDAIQFDAALRKNPNCWQTFSLGNGALAWSIDGQSVALRDEHKVAFVRGLPQPLANTVATHLLTLPQTSAPPVPIGQVQIPHRGPLPEPQKGYIHGNAYQSAWLGLMATLPMGVPAWTNDEHLELKLDRRDMGLMGALALSDRITTPKFIDKLFQEVEIGFESAFDDSDLVALGGGPSTHPLGPAIERSWSVAGTLIQLRVVVVPVCNGTGSYVFIQTFTDPYAKSVLDGWLYSFRWMSPTKPPICNLLDPD